MREGSGREGRGRWGTKLFDVQLKWLPHMLVPFLQHPQQKYITENPTNERGGGGRGRETREEQRGRVWESRRKRILKKVLRISIVGIPNVNLWCLRRDSYKKEKEKRRKTGRRGRVRIRSRKERYHGNHPSCEVIATAPSKKAFEILK